MQRWVRFLGLILLLGLVGGDRLALAQGRLSDKDLQQLMQNLKDDAGPFRQNFANALKKSTIRGTSQEKDAKALADTFAKQANTALETFKHQQKADPQVVELVHTAAQIDPLVYSLQLNPQTTIAVGETAHRAAPDRAGLWRTGALPGAAAGERFCGPQHYGDVSECGGDRAVTAAGERMHTGFACDSPAMQCAECMLADCG